MSYQLSSAAVLANVTNLFNAGNYAAAYRAIRDDLVQQQNSGVAIEILAAARLVMETDCSLEEVAEKVGFSNLGHFRRRFRKSLGCNPSDLRLAAGIDPSHAATILSASMELPGASAGNFLPVAGERSSASQNGQTEEQFPRVLTCK
jgi:hypothetical protein